MLYATYDQAPTFGDLENWGDTVSQGPRIYFDNAACTGSGWIRANEYIEAGAGAYALPVDGRVFRAVSGESVSAPNKSYVLSNNGCIADVNGGPWVELAQVEGVSAPEVLPGPVQVVAGD